MTYDVFAFFVGLIVIAIVALVLVQLWRWIRRDR